MAVTCNKILAVLLYISHLKFTCQERILGKEDEEFDFDGLPGAHHEFKIDVAAGKEDCFVQKVALGASLHVSFEILNGDEKTCDFYLKDEEGGIIEYASQSTNANFEQQIEKQGNYQICIDNTFSRFSSKLVYVYIVTFVMDEWSKYVQEITEVNTAVVNFTTSISEVQRSIEQMILHQTQSRMMVIKDWYLIVGNNAYVMYWSFAQIAIILTATCFQVYFVRRLFKVPNVTPSSKPRA